MAINVSFENDYLLNTNCEFIQFLISFSNTSQLSKILHHFSKRFEKNVGD